MASDNDEAQELIRWAEDAIGNDEPEDYRIHPTDFPNTLQESAPKLADFLRNAALTETAKRFLARDNEAVRLQAAFERISSRVTWAIFAATVSGAVLASLSAVPGDPTWWLRAIFFMLGLCAMGAGALAAAGLHRVRSGGLLSEWMSSRAAAESERLGYFNKALSAIMKGGGDDASVCLLFLEFFRRYQMAVQQLYYRDRRTQHIASRDKTGNIGAVAVFVLFLGSGGFGLVAAFQPEVLPLAALGTVGAALAAVAARREELGQDARNSERYRRTWEALSKIRERHSDVQEAVSQGNRNVLRSYVAAVHEQLSVEHRQWLDDTEAMSAALQDLEASLA